MSIRYGGGRKAVSVGSKVPAELYDKFNERYPRKGDKSRVIRALIQMHLDGKITNLKYQFVDSI